jgi:hypothetical protein
MKKQNDELKFYIVLCVVMIALVLIAALTASQDQPDANSLDDLQEQIDETRSLALAAIASTCQNELLVRILLDAEQKTMDECMAARFEFAKYIQEVENEEVIDPIKDFMKGE